MRKAKKGQGHREENCSTVGSETLNHYFGTITKEWFPTPPTPLPPPLDPDKKKDQFTLTSLPHTHLQWHRRCWTHPMLETQSSKSAPG